MEANHEILDGIEPVTFRNVEDGPPIVGRV
jgi:hypothetical protein